MQCRVSPLMSSHHSPKSPPNSPNNERSEYYGGDTDLRQESVTLGIIC